MGRYLSVGILGLAAALSASIIPQFIAFAVDALGELAPLLADTRGRLNLVMLVVICWSARASLSESLVWGVVGGLLVDMHTVLPLGATSAALCLFAFAVNSAARQLARARLSVLLAFTPVATALLAVYNLLWLALLGDTYALPALLREFLLPTIAYNLIAITPTYVFVRAIQRRLEGGLQIAPQSLAQATAPRGDE